MVTESPEVVSYFLYIFERVGAVGENEMLCWSLFKKDYYWINPMNENRAMDALDLRCKYLDWAYPGEGNHFTDAINQTSPFYGPATVLEVLWSICNRLAEMENPYEKPADVSGWMTELLANLGLSDSNQGYKTTPDYELYVHEKVSEWMEEDPHGGDIFKRFAEKTLHNSPDIFRVMQTYFVEFHKNGWRGKTV